MSAIDRRPPRPVSARGARSPGGVFVRDALAGGASYSVKAAITTPRATGFVSGPLASVELTE